ncbi:Hemocyanin, ig-like domain [Popillia japonica]|uniref:Hemocyanin, ig-like domain n=1 Tax=Popillia japonica TaxID=7064 RepID=A0AAW1MCU5_POPJA
MEICTDSGILCCLISTILKDDRYEEREDPQQHPNLSGQIFRQPSLREGQGGAAGGSPRFARAREELRVVPPGSRVEQDLTGSCNDGESYCGVRGGKYPDRRSMGYPFDRVGRRGAETLQRFLTPNMRVQSCTILNLDKTVRPKTN